MRTVRPPSRVFLHVGAPLTGSTYLRSALGRHRRALTRFGVCYPTSHVGDEEGHLDAILDVLDLRAADHLAARGAWERLAQGARDWRRGTVVISHELMADADETQVQRILGSFGGAELHVVYTARDLGRQVPLAWQEWVVNGGTAPFDRYVDLLLRRTPHRTARVFWRSHDVDAVLRRWAAFVPASRIHVVTVPDSDEQDAVLWHRFARLVGLDPERFAVGADTRRRLLPLAGLEALRLLNVELGPADDGTRGRRVAQALAAQPGPRPQLPTGYADLLRAEGERTVASVESGRYDVVGHLADLVPDLGLLATSPAVLVPPAGDVLTAQTRLLAALV